MAKDKLTDYDSTASGNLDVGGISVAEGMLPSGVNNAIREQMSHLADFAAGSSGVDVLKLQDDTDTNSIKLQAPASVTTTVTFTLPDGDGTADQVLKTDGSGQLGWVAQPAVASNPSLIINGAMQVSQRGTSETGVTSSQYANAPDRFVIGMYDCGTWTVSQSTTTPDGFANSYKLDCTTAKATLASDSNIQFYQRLEGQDLQQLQKGTSGAKSVTVSFYVRTNKTGTYTLELFDRDNTRVFSKTYSVSSANTWEYKSVTFEGDTTGAFDNDNGNSLDVSWWLAAGTDYTGGTFSSGWASRVDGNRASPSQVNIADSTSNEWHITGIKLEVGDTATDFEHRSFGDELARCQRYYHKSTVDFYGTAGSGGLVGYVVWDFKVSMRTSPTITGGNGTWQNISPEFGNMYAGTGTYPYVTSGATADAEL